MDPALLFIIIFIAAPLLERLLKNKQQPPPPQQRPRRERPQVERPRQEEPSAPLPRAEQRDEPATAADMLPDDLWEILTGQKREQPAPPRELPPEPAKAEPRAETPLPQPRRPRPGIVRKSKPAPAPPERTGRMQTASERTPARRAEVAYDEEAELKVEATREQPPVEGYVREIPVYKAPEIVSLEELVIDDEKRHARFHERIKGSKVATVQREEQHRLKKLLRQRAQLRRAVVLNEVLGQPRGLD